MYNIVSYYEYLTKKYGVSTPTTMLKVEADMMGLRYPLVSGWRERHHEWLNRKLNQQEAESFLAGLIRKKKATQASIKSGKEGSKEWAELHRRVVSLQTGIDLILGREFCPINHEDKRLIEEEINSRV
jgi:hypothetical protein